MGEIRELAGRRIGGCGCLVRNPDQPHVGGDSMMVLVACEFSGRVRDAFIANGHEAMSCDLLPTDKPGPHYQGDVFDVIN